MNVFEHPHRSFEAMCGKGSTAIDQTSTYKTKVEIKMFKYELSIL